MSVTSKGTSRARSLATKKVTKATPLKVAKRAIAGFATELTIDQWFEREDHQVDKIHRSLRLKRLRNTSVIDEVELGRRVSQRIAKEEGAFVEAVLLARTVARIETPDDNNYGLDLIAEAWSNLPEWFREMHARSHGEKPIIRNVPGWSAAFADQERRVRREVEAQMQAELEAAKDGQALDERKQWLLRSEIEDFANNLETARIIYARHPKLVTAPRFPEPYRAAMIEHQQYDPQQEEGVNVGDMHIIDPVQAELLRDREARESLTRLNRA